MVLADYVGLYLLLQVVEGWLCGRGRGGDFLHFGLCSGESNRTSNGRWGFKTVKVVLTTQV